MIALILRVLGLLSFTAGAALLAPWLGLLVLGVCLYLLGVGFDLSPKPDGEGE